MGNPQALDHPNLWRKLRVVKQTKKNKSTKQPVFLWFWHTEVLVWRYEQTFPKCNRWWMTVYDAALKDMPTRKTDEWIKWTNLGTSQPQKISEKLNISTSIVTIPQANLFVWGFRSFAKRRCLSSSSSRKRQLAWLLRVCSTCQEVGHVKCS